MEQLLLWRWSAAVQLTSLVIITLFFSVLARSVGIPEMKWWVRAWLANLAALGITLVFWIFQPAPIGFTLLTAMYVLAKTMFAVFLLQGAWAFKRPGPSVLRGWHVLPAIVLSTVTAVLVLTSINRLGMFQHVLLGTLLGVGALALLSPPRQSGLTWLASGLIARSLLSYAEAAAYGIQLLPSGSVSTRAQEFAATFLSAHSSFDSGAEWLIALGCVLAVSEQAQRQLLAINVDLLAAQEDLLKLADRDPLTKLSNRRSLSHIFRTVERTGATVLFFDLDDFKRINDRYGHQVGDKCLKRFADALRECFRPGDALVRYAGDEFLVVASGLDAASVTDRIERLREKLNGESAAGPELSFSVGVSDLAPGGLPETALRQADNSMYEAKAARRVSVRTGTK